MNDINITGYFPRCFVYSSLVSIIFSLGSIKYYLFVYHMEEFLFQKKFVTCFYHFSVKFYSRWQWCYFLHVKYLLFVAIKGNWKCVSKFVICMLYKIVFSIPAIFFNVIICQIKNKVFIFLSFNFIITNVIKAGI